MKKLELRSSAYKAILAQFSEHLQTLNYSKDTVYNASNSVKEYVHFLETNAIALNQTTSPIINSYFAYLQTRKNERTDGGLSEAYLQKHRTALIQFYSFLHLMDIYSVSLVFPEFSKSRTLPKVLSVDQVKKLFASCERSLLGDRDKAVLAIYYGLGLRRSEGVQLVLSDVDFQKEEVFIQKSKTYQQRIVPMSDHVKQILEHYVFNVREKLVPEDRSTHALLVTEQGKPLSQESVSYIIRKRVLASKINVKASPHTLRHSIATHLLQGGMSLENIALFLGHTSLDSTQIYTHIKHS